MPDEMTELLTGILDRLDLLAARSAVEPGPCWADSGIAWPGGVSPRCELRAGHAGAHECDRGSMGGRAVWPNDAVLAEHATPSDDTAAMWIDPNPPGVTPLPPEQAKEILDALDDTPSDPPQDDDWREWGDDETPGCGSYNCGRADTVKSERWGGYLCPSHAMTGPVRLSAPSDPPQGERPWCYEESCVYRHWRSGPMPTHRRGTSCPAPASADTEGVRLTEGEREELRFALAHYVREYDEGSRVYGVVERIRTAAYNAGLVEGANIGIHMRAATECKGEAR